jgi:hypothetical protein
MPPSLRTITTEASYSKYLENGLATEKFAKYAGDPVGAGKKNIVE